MGHLKHTIHINAPVDKVADYTEPPSNWPTFMVGMSEPERIVGDVGPGQQVDFTTTMLGMHLHLSVRTTDDRRDPDGGGFWRGEFTGAQSGWMAMGFKPDSGGTLITQEMEYTTPGGLLGRAADHLIFERMQERDMLHSLENLKLLMEESPG
jgi:hypothetical protein